MSLRQFSSDLKETQKDPEPTPQSTQPGLKATPKSGFKMPKLKEGQTIVGFRPHGNTDILSPTKNFNFEMQR